MKITCNCGNEIELKQYKQNEPYKIVEEDDEKFNFVDCCVANALEIICVECGDFVAF